MSQTDEIVFDLEREVAAIAAALGLPASKVKAAAELLGEGNTIPFVARYRKERTGGLDETALRAIEDAIDTLRELIERKNTVLKTIAEQGKLDAALREKILACREKKELEELYLPYKPKRRTRAAIARERGLEGLAAILKRQVNPGGSRGEVLRPYIDPDREVPDAEAALHGACDIVAEEWADDGGLRGVVREAIEQGMLVSRVRRDWAGKPGKFEMYYDHREPLAKVPSHRYLAMRRGEAEEVLRLAIEIDDEPLIRRLTGRLVTNPSFLFRHELVETVADCCRRLLFPSLEAALLAEKKEAADEEAIRVFAQNLRELLLFAPAGPRAVLGIDPGFRTGCKVAVIDATGKFLEHATIYPTPPHNKTEEARRVLLALLDRHGVELIAVGSGTASRETDAFLAAVLRSAGAKAAKVTVNESGASIYSASETARAEFPDLDLTVRGAISIARRLQDPLAELVKIDRQVDRRGPVPARREPGQAPQDARPRGRVVRQPGGGRSEYGQRATAELRVRHRAEDGGVDPALPRRPRRVFQPRGAALRSAAGQQGLPAGGRVPARARRPPAAGQLGRPSGKLLRRGEDGPRRAATPAALVGNTAAIRRLDPAPVRRRAGRRCPRSPTSSPSWKSRAAIRGRSSACRSSPKGSTSSPTCAKA